MMTGTASSLASARLDRKIFAVTVYPSLTGMGTSQAQSTSGSASTRSTRGCISWPERSARIPIGPMAAARSRSSLIRTFLLDPEVDTRSAISVFNSVE